MTALPELRWIAQIRSLHHSNRLETFCLVYCFVKVITVSVCTHLHLTFSTLIVFLVENLITWWILPSAFLFAKSANVATKPETSCNPNLVHLTISTFIVCFFLFFIFALSIWNGILFTELEYISPAVINKFLLMRIFNFCSKKKKILLKMWLDLIENWN